MIGSIMIRHDRGSLFFGLILPHGLLELTAVFVAAGVGLRLFWSWVAPGDRSRAQNLAAEGRAAGGVAMGLAVVLLVSGIIEAFVTPSGLPTWGRIAIGVAAEVGVPRLRLRAGSPCQAPWLDRRHRRLPARGRVASAAETDQPRSPPRLDAADLREEEMTRHRNRSR